jgi:hypothetical protein
MGKRKFITTECLICLDEINLEDINNIILNCGHNYHIGCIQLWFSTLTQKYTCPECRDPQNTKKLKIIIIPPGENYYNLQHSWQQNVCTPDYDYNYKYIYMAFAIMLIILLTYSFI